MRTEGQGFQLVVKGTSYSLLSLIAVRALTVISSIAVARMLGKTNLGMLAIINNITGLAVLFATLGVPTALTKYVAQYAAQDRTKLGPVVGTSLVALLVPVILLSAGLFLAAGPIARGIYHEPALTLLIRIAAAILLANSLGTFGFGQALLQGLKEVKRISIINIVASAIGLPVVIGLTAAFHLTGTATAQLILAALGAILLARGIRQVGFRFGTLKFDRAFLSRLLNLAFPAFFSGLVMTPALWITTTRLSVAKGFSEVGLFNICFGLFQMILFLPMAVGMPLIPMIAESYRTDSERLKRLIRPSLEIVAFVTLLLSAAIGIFARPVIFLLYGPGYLEAARPMTLMAGAVFFSSLGYVVGHYFSGTGKMWTGMGFNLLWFGVLIGLALWLITGLGVLGLAAAFWISYLLMAIGILIYARTVISIPIGYLALLSVLSLGVTFLSQSFLLRLHGLASVGSGLALLAVVAGLDYWLLPAKAELRSSLALVVNRLRGRGPLPGGNSR